jgi:RNA polymerase primary sigma factor
MTTAVYDEKIEPTNESDHIELRNALVETNQGLVISIAKRYANRYVPIEDLIQEGNLGLIAAAERFDTEMGYQFSTYAVWWIRGYISKAIRDETMNSRKLQSLDLPVDEDGDNILASLIPDENTMSPCELARKNELKEHVKEMVSCLKPCERRVIELRFGIDEIPEHSLRETGEILGISRERIRQIEVKALGRLRKLAGSFHSIELLY